MPSLRRIFAVFALVLLAGCHGRPAPQNLPENCPSVHKNYDLTLCWKAERGADRFIIAGYATNTRFSYITDLEITASLLDEQGKKLGESTSFVIPRLIAMDEADPFTLAVPLRAEEKPAKIRFFYRYRLTRVDDGKTPQFNSFVTDLR